MKLLFWRKPRVPVLVLHGILARRAALNIGSYGPLIDRACAAAKGAHLVLDIESPGGSPVQSDLIARRIRAGAARHDVTVHAVIGEVGASGGYWLACAADRILANPMSLVGSIGVVSGGFGFDRAWRGSASTGACASPAPTRPATTRSRRNARRTRRSPRPCSTSCTSASRPGCASAAARR